MMVNIDRQERGSPRNKHPWIAVIVSRLIEGQRPTLSVGGAIPLSGVLDWMKRRKWAEHQRSALCFLTMAAVGSSVSDSCRNDFPHHDGLDPHTVSHMEHFLTQAACARQFVTTMRKVTVIEPYDALILFPQEPRGAIPLLISRRRSLLSRVISSSFWAN